MKAATLDKLQQAARGGQCRLLYFDEAGFCAAPPVQRSWSPRGLPHSVEPNSHCRRSVLGALDFGQNAFIHATSAKTVKGSDVVEFLDAIIGKNHLQPTVIVLDNARIHHSIDLDTQQRWFVEHKALLFYLPSYSPELNLIEIVWKHFKYHWRRFMTWNKETIDAELSNLLSGYGNKFQISFS